MLTAERAAQALNYCPDSGVFTWRIKVGSRRPAGSAAGKIDRDGYRLIGLDGRKYRAARLAFFMSYGRWPSDQIDHINGDRLDDRLCNLREANQVQNSQNMAVRKSSVSQRKGVDYHRGDGAWRARIRVNGKRVFLGNFSTQDLAHAAYVKAAAEFHGEFARSNWQATQ